MDVSDTKSEAQYKGYELIAKLGTKDWELRIHENLGWHYSAFYKPFKNLHVSGSRHSKDRVQYFAMLSDSEQHWNCNSCLWASRPYFDDPRDAVKDILSAARSVVNNLNSIVSRAEKADVWEMIIKKVYKD